MSGIKKVRGFWGSSQMTSEGLFRSGKASTGCCLAGMSACSTYACETTSQCYVEQADIPAREHSVLALPDLNRPSEVISCALLFIASEGRPSQNFGGTGASHFYVSQAYVEQADIHVWVLVQMQANDLHIIISSGCQDVVLTS